MTLERMVRKTCCRRWTTWRTVMKFKGSSIPLVQVLERIKDPLMTLVSRDHHETAYAVLAHFLIIAQRAPLIFASVRMTPF